jgi:hypothetical protein
MNRRLGAFIVLAQFAGACSLAGQTGRWTVYEKTAISGVIVGVVKMGYVFKTISGNYYQVAEPIVEVMVEVMPDVTVLRSGEVYRLTIKGVKNPIFCTKLGGPIVEAIDQAVIESRLDGESEGFTGESIFPLLNEQVWLQTDGYYQYRYQFGPKVIIYREGSGYKLKLEGIEQAVSVQRLR